MSQFAPRHGTNTWQREDWSPDPFALEPVNFPSVSVQSTEITPPTSEFCRKGMTVPPSNLPQRDPLPGLNRRRL